MDKIKFQHESFPSLKEKIKKGLGNKTTIFNFINSHDLYNFKKIPEFRKSLEKDRNINFIDGFIISLLVSIKNFKIVNRIRGPSFTQEFLSDRELSKEKKHFFIGKEKKEIKKLAKKYCLGQKSISSYNPPYIKENVFSEKEVEKIVGEINKFKPHYIWVGIGCPKQNILSNDLADKTKAECIFNVGAGIDFVLGSKKEAPKIIQRIGLEWFYRLVTDFKYSKKKVWRSLIGSFYGLGIIEL